MDEGAPAPISAVQTVRSADATEIAYQLTGGGEPVLLIGGAFSNRFTSQPLAAGLAAHYTVVSYDRRGRGASGDADAYAVEREIEDLAALIAGVGGSASLFGHSSGGCLALEGAAQGLPVNRVAVYEAPYIPDEIQRRPGADLSQRLRALVDQGRRGDAVALFQTEAIGMPAEMVEGFRATPMWAELTALAHTLPYDVDVTGPGNVLPAQRLATITVPVLVMVGSASFDWMRIGMRTLAATIPGARLAVLDGLDHGGPQSHPQALVPVLRDFLG
jgi:pimeloyl-ACP methyl ester carboxylesterase